jgi:DNA-binding response OmpR family regulator
VLPDDRLLPFAPQDAGLPVARVRVVWIDGGAHPGLERDLRSLGHALLPPEALQPGDGAERIDVVLIDIACGRVWELIASARSALAQAPILLIVARDLPLSGLVRALEMGATGHLTYPLPLRVLDAWVHWAARRSRGQHGPPRLDEGAAGGAAPLRIDGARRSAFIHGRELLLTQGAFELLNALYRHRNRVLSREWLLRSLCDISDIQQTRALDVRVAVLRRALAPLVVGRVPRIETVRGVGYRLVV